MTLKMALPDEVNGNRIVCGYTTGTVLGKAMYTFAGGVNKVLRTVLTFFAWR